jgi:broad specificity phosphatase PhoE
MTQTVWIARHANRLDFVNPDWFLTAEKRYDPPLSDDGIIQAQQLAQRLQTEKIKHIFASPFLRTVQTAQEIAEKLDLTIKIETGLSEWLNPEWMTENPEKETLTNLARTYPRLDLTYQAQISAIYPETETAVIKRAGETAKILVNQNQEDILLIAHGASVLGALMGLLAIEQPPQIKIGLCSLTKLVRNGQKWELELNADRSHLMQIETKIRYN